MKDFLQFSHVSEQTEPSSSLLVGFFTALGIVLLFGMIFQEARTTYAQSTNETQYVAKSSEPKD